MSYKVGVIRGDGIGPEIVAEALKVLDKVAEKYNENVRLYRYSSWWCIY